MPEASTLSADEAAEFAVRCRGFLSAYAPRYGRPNLAAARRFQAALNDAGLAGLAYPREYGGAGLTLEHERIYRAVAQEFPAMASELVISHGMVLPVINEFGTEEQKRRFMPDNIAARTLWCQMFSEPGAGSDVASLQTRAVRDDSGWVLNGQKVWTTLAHECDFGILLARTDPSVPKHAGISMFLVDMRAPGVEVRRIHQIDGGRHFNEVFFTDVWLDPASLLGELNNGWRQATAMLMYERVAISSLRSGQISHPMFDLLLAAAQASERDADPVVREQLMQIYCMETTKSLVAMRSRAELKAGRAPGPGSSIGKLASSLVARRFREIGLDIAGPGSQAWLEGDEASANLQKQMLNSFQVGIAGGTDEIQRNIIGERVLGLPREVAVDAGVPFKDLKVGTQR
jgi:alkylation response protein AidB-like acyl-CoA dehydrogenase